MGGKPAPAGLRPRRPGGGYRHGPHHRPDVRLCM